MGALTDQIRDCIRKSGVSRYALAKQVGIAESSLSRFMAGAQGLTLVTIDKLADALGLEVVMTVQRVSRPAPRGRKPKEKKKMIAATTKPDWKEIAYLFAKDANENHFASRRGIWFLEDVGVLCVYNNNPYVGDPKARDKETAEFRKRMNAAGIKVLAYATNDDGYSYAMLLDAGEEKESFVVNAMKEVIKGT